VSEARHAGVREAGTVGMLAAALGVWAVVGSEWLHPHLTKNADEATYLQQGAALASGHLTGPAPGDLRTFQPWFGVVRDGRYVFKYTLVWPAVISVGRVLGSPRVALFLAAVAAVVGTYLLAREILGSHRRALLASALFTVAPLTAFIATTFLSYLWFSALWTFAAWSTLRAARTRRALTAVVAGLLAGTAWFARPYEAIFVLGPFAVWLVWDGRRELGALARRVGWIALGAALPVAVFLATNARLTGSAFTSTLTLWDPLDRPGFGARRILGSGPAQVDFGPRDGVVGMAKHLALLQWWSAGGVVLGVLAVVGLVAAWRRRGIVPLAAVMVTLPLALVYFWGAYAVSSLWAGFLRPFGPFYVMPLLVPLVILAVEGLAWLRSRSTAWVVAVATVLVVITGVNLARALDANLDARRARERHYDALDGVGRTKRALVLVPTWSHFLGTGPNGALVNFDADPRVLYANQLGGESDIDAVEAFPDRTPYRLERRGRTTKLDELQVVSGATLAFTVNVVDTLGAEQAVLEVGSGDRRFAITLSAGDTRFAGGTAVLVVGPHGVTLAGTPMADAGARVPGALSVSLSLSGIPGDPPGATRVYEWQAPERLGLDTVTVLLPGVTKRGAAGPDGPKVKTDIGDVLRVRPAPGAVSSARS